MWANMVQPKNLPFSEHVRQQENRVSSIDHGMMKHSSLHTTSSDVGDVVELFLQNEFMCDEQ